MKDRAPPDEPDDPEAFERFKNLTRRLIAVPKKEVDVEAKKPSKARRKRR